MSVRFVQASESQHLAAEARSRRRSLPPSQAVSVSQSGNQRWRERPRCRALHLTPACRDGAVHAIVGRVVCRCLRALFVQEKRAALAPMCVPRIAGTMWPMTCRAIGSRARPVLPQNTTWLSAQNEPLHHRADKAGAVLRVVNALRCASTRPTVGPAGIDDASARHPFSNYAMVVSMMTTRTRLTRTTRGRMVGSSPQCHTALLRFATAASGARIRPTLPGHGSSAPFTTSQPVVMTSGGAAFSGPGAAGGSVHQRRDHALV
jgi:hypothetical protein